MIKLLNAGFYRLKKSKIFWSVVVFSVVLALFIIYASGHDMIKYNDVIEVEQLMIDYATMVGIIISIFTSLFLGIEYSDGAIRNKISIGHKRVNIYLSNLIITFFTSVVSYLMFLLIMISIGIPMFGKITIPISELLTYIGCIFMMMLSYSSIFTFITMMISSKTITAVVNIILAFGMLIVAIVCLNILDTPQYVTNASLIDGKMKFEEVLNPKYPSEAKKKFHQTLLDINPAGQGFQIAGRITPNIKVLPIYSLGNVVLFTGLGLILFKKKELK